MQIRMFSIVSPVRLAGRQFLLDPAQSQEPGRQIDPCDSLETAAMYELVAQLVEQRPFNPILPLKSKIRRNSDIHDNYH